MLIRKNTKTFKTILEIVTACQDRPDREKLIRLYITKAGHSIEDRINVEGIQGDAALFYDLNYHAVRSNLESSDRQLHQSDDVPGIYFFHSASNKAWDETPFEFDELIKKDFGSLPDLPVVRKKEKAEKFVFQASNVKPEPRSKQKEKAVPKKTEKVIEKGPRQPDYKLKHKIHFTNLDKIVFRKPQLSKKDVLDYYNKVSDYILPYLKDRTLSIVLSEDGRPKAYDTFDAVAETVDMPEWIKNVPAKKEHGRMLLCNDKNHLLFYGEIGGVEFNAVPSRTQASGTPDYIVIRIESLRAEFNNTIDAALAAKTILTGLQLPSFLKTDGQSGFHIYVPLDAKSKFAAVKAVAEYLCKLIQLKVPDLVALQGADEQTYGKVTLDYSLNDMGARVVAPYSLVAGESPMVATPLLWEEVKVGLELDDFNHETIFKRLKQIGDPFETLLRKKVNGDALLEKMEENYSFLF